MRYKVGVHPSYCQCLHGKKSSSSLKFSSCWQCAVSMISETLPQSVDEHWWIEDIPKWSSPAWTTLPWNKLLWTRLVYSLQWDNWRSSSLSCSIFLGIQLLKLFKDNKPTSCLHTNYKNEQATNVDSVLSCTKCMVLLTMMLRHNIPTYFHYWES